MVPRNYAPKFSLGALFLFTDEIKKLGIQDPYSKFDELDIIKNYKDEYMKLLVLIKYMCVRQNDMDLMYKIYNNVNKINNLFMKKVYLLYCYFEYSKDCWLNVLNYIGISDELIKTRIGFEIDYDITEFIKRLFQSDDINNLQNKNIIENKNNIDYNLNHLPKQKKMNKVICRKTNIRRIL